MSCVKLIFGTCNSVPSAETESHFEDLYQKALTPFLKAVYNRSDISSTLFYSGPLLDWLERRHPEFITVLHELVSRKSAELLSGAYCEPMLPLIPAADRTGQIEMMTTALRKRFGKRSKGIWIRVWEQHLVSSLKSSGMDYAFLSEDLLSGIEGFRPQSPVVAEDQGKTIVIFPVMKSLEDSFLTLPPEQFVDSLRSFESGGGQEVVISLIPDGQTLCGMDHATWFERFFKAVDQADWLECIHPGRYLKTSAVIRQKMYIPAPSYDTMMRWTATPNRQPDSALRPVNHYRDFLTRYRESALLYAKMVHTGVLTGQLRGDKSRKKNAREELWRGQEHHAYWHGPAGGICSSRIRHKAYSALIEAEKITREKGIFKSALTSEDFDMDGEKEYLYNGHNYNAYIHTTGGALFEFDYLPVSRNYLATFSRCPESYHPPEIREQGYDSYARHAFLDHILRPSDSPAGFERGRHYTPDNSFVLRAYQPVEVIRDQPKISLSCRGPVHGDSDELEILKTYSFQMNTLEVLYTLTNLTSKTLEFTWGPEINLALDDDPENHLLLINEKGVKAAGNRASQTENWSVTDIVNDVLITFQLSEPAELWHSGISANYRSGPKLIKACQSLFFLPSRNVKLPSAGSAQWSITMNTKRTRSR